MIYTHSYTPQTCCLYTSVRDRLTHTSRCAACSQDRHRSRSRQIPAHDRARSLSDKVHTHLPSYPRKTLPDMRTHTLPHAGSSLHTLEVVRKK